MASSLPKGCSHDGDAMEICHEGTTTVLTRNPKNAMIPSRPNIKRDTSLPTRTNGVTTSTDGDDNGTQTGSLGLPLTIEKMIWDYVDFKTPKIIEPKFKRSGKELFAVQSPIQMWTLGKQSQQAAISEGYVEVVVHQWVGVSDPIQVPAKFVFHPEIDELYLSGWVLLTVPFSEFKKGLRAAGALSKVKTLIFDYRDNLQIVDNGRCCYIKDNITALDFRGFSGLKEVKIVLYERRHPAGYHNPDPHNPVYFRSILPTMVQQYGRSFHYGKFLYQKDMLQFCKDLETQWANFGVSAEVKLVCKTLTGDKMAGREISDEYCALKAKWEKNPRGMDDGGIWGRNWYGEKVKEDDVEVGNRALGLFGGPLSNLLGGNFTEMLG